MTKGKKDSAFCEPNKKKERTIDARRLRRVFPESSLFPVSAASAVDHKCKKAALFFWSSVFFSEVFARTGKAKACGLGGRKIARTTSTRKKDAARTPIELSHWVSPFLLLSNVGLACWRSSP